MNILAGIGLLLLLVWGGLALYHCVQSSEGLVDVSELKGRIKELKKVPTDEGKQTERYGSVQSIKEVQLNIVDIENVVGELQDRIEELQNELDIHNATTNI
jgi:hypothetical protein